MQTSSLIFLSLILLSVHSLNLESKLRTKDTSSSRLTFEQNSCSNSAPAEGCVWLFTDYVTKIEVCANNPDLRTVSFDKIALAVQVGPTTNVTLYNSYNYQGSTKFYGTTGYYQLLDFLCQTSSVGVISSRIVNYNIRGYLKSALTNAVFTSDQISGGHVQVIFTNSAGKNFSSTINAANSTYSISLPSGTYTRWAVMDGMVQATTQITVGAADSLETVNENSVLFAPVITGWRAVLSWNTEQDLDTYVITPSGDKVWYRKKASDDGSVNLDIDNRVGSGPETLTFNFTKTSAGTYKYFVNSYSKKPLDQSQSKVVVYHGNGQVAEMSPPANPKTYWYVFKIDVVANGAQTFAIVNQYTDTLA